jgi:uncharacterized Zn-binding protein involved in type VI secretion
MATQTFTINTPSNINANFDKQGSKNARVQVTGTGSANIQFTLDWSDNPGVAGDAIGSIGLNGMSFNSPGDNGSQTRDRVFTPGNYDISFSGLLNDFKAVNNKSITMIDDDGDDTNATFSLDKITNITTTTTITVSGNISASPQTMTGTNVFNLTWSSSGATSVTINGSPVAAGGTRTENTGLQSTAGSNSPATRTYTIQACNGSNCVSESVTVSVFNDGTPNDFSIGSRTGLEPNASTSIFVTTISGIDQPITAFGGAGVQVSTNGSSWSSGSISIVNGNQFWVRATSPPFNTDPSGLTNTSTFSATVGPLTRSFSLTTRAPDVNETFNYSNEDDRVPFPDIDTITTPPDNPAEQYISTNTLSVDDIEIPVEIKTNNSNCQVRIKSAGASSFGSWRDVRSI